MANINENVIVSFKKIAEAITPQTGTPNKLRDEVMGGSSLLITTPPQNPKAVATMLAYKSAHINVWFQTM